MAPEQLSLQGRAQEKTMYRKILIIIAMLFAGATALAPTAASARGGRGGGGRGGGYSRGGGGYRGGRGWGWGGAALGLGLGLGAAGYYGGYGYAPYGCWRRVVVDTPYGPRSRRIWVC
jgi:hypothetical protein